ncbi:MAG: mechanosensitive ion channel [Treponema sp.]|jgi:small conductance mechanosensitive channel|nr:mechanosensitive ion channel [Treponema sp.]
MFDEIISIWDNNKYTILIIGKKLLASGIIFGIGIILTRGFKKIIEKATAAKLHVDDTRSSILRHIINYGIFIICVILILNIFGINTASLIAVLGAAGLAIGLALKDTLGNIAASISLFFLGSYRLGEFIEFDSFMGTVKEINPFTTILETPEGIYISAPNSCIWGNPIKNYSRNGKRRMELFIRISYFDSIDTAFNVLNEIIISETRFLKTPAPQIVVQSLQDSSVNLCVRAWANNQDYWDIYWFQMRNIKEKIEEAGLHIPFPQQEIYICDKPDSKTIN